MAVAVEQFVKQLEDSGILAGETIKDFIPPKAAPKDAEDLARQLVKQKKLTKFQAEEVYRGKGKSLVIGNYLLMEKIGAGGMGQVFKARHRRMDRFVAVKLLPPAMTKDKAAISRFEREVKAAAKLRHPNIVAADDADCANGVHFLVMELVEGLDLSALVRKNGPLSTGKAVNYVLQAARGLEFAHRKGVVHRDIKPANLLLDTDGTVKILDMGLARLGGVGDDSPQADLTSTGTIMGTVDYMAPEQALDTKTADARADIYALGCSLHYLLTGKPTYDGDTIMKKLLAHRDQPIPSLRAGRSEVPGQLEVVFKKMIAKKLEDRYQTMGEVIADLKGMEVGQEATVIIQQTANTPSSTNTFNDNGAFHVAQNLLATKTIPKSKAKSSDKGKARPPLWKNIKVLIGTALLGVLLLAGIIVSLDTEDGKLIVEVDQLDAMVQVLDEEGKVEVSQKGGGGKLTISVDPGKHRLKVVKDGFTTYGQEFEMEKGGKREVTAKLVPVDTAEVSAQPVPVSGEKQRLGFQRPGFDEWIQKVAKLPAEQQVEAVSKKLVELNPGFDGKLESSIDGGVVHTVGFLTDHVSDISPVRALVRLANLYCYGREAGSGTLTDLSPLNGLSLTSLFIGNNKLLSDLSPLKGQLLKALRCQQTSVADLTPLQGMPLSELFCIDTNVTTLMPLKGMPLTVLNCHGTKIADLSPLHGMPLTYLNVPSTSVSDLSPLRGMKLTYFCCVNSLVSDLAPLSGMPLQQLLIHATPVTDVSLIRGMPLESISLDFKPERDADLLRSIKTLETINNQPAAEFWKAVDANKPGKQPLGFLRSDFNEWVKEVAVLPAEQQVQAVGKKLVELNPGFDGKVTGDWSGQTENDAGTVTAFSFLTDHVSDISPVRALTVRSCLLDCSASGPGKGILVDLSPLNGTQFTFVVVSHTQVSDLSPLRGMSLTHLNLTGTPVSDLSPIQGMNLKWISLEHSKVTDLSALHGMQMEGLNLPFTNISDLSPLQGMNLTYLYCVGSPVSDLSPLKGMPLQILDLSQTQVSDLSPLQGMKLEALCGSQTLISDLSPLTGMPLMRLLIDRTTVTDLSPLRQMPLKFLSLDFKPERDTELLRSIKTLEMVNDKPVAEFWKEVEGEKPGQ